MLPQIFFLTLGSIISFVCALEFGYSESPKNLHTVIAAFWFLTNCIGNITVITNVGLFSLQVSIKISCDHYSKIINTYISISVNYNILLRRFYVCAFNNFNSNDSKIQICAISTNED